MVIKSMQRAPLRKRRKEGTAKRKLKRNRKESRSTSDLPSQRRVFALTESAAEEDGVKKRDAAHLLSRSPSSRLIDQARRGSVQLGLALYGGKGRNVHFADGREDNKGSIAKVLEEEEEDEEEAANEILKKGEIALKVFKEFQGSGVDTSNEVWVRENASPEKYFGAESTDRFFSQYHHDYENLMHLRPGQKVRPITARREFIMQCNKNGLYPEPLILRQAGKHELKLAHLEITEGRSIAVAKSLPLLPICTSIDLSDCCLSSVALERTLRAIIFKERAGASMYEIAIEEVQAKEREEEERQRDPENGGKEEADQKGANGEKKKSEKSAVPEGGNNDKESPARGIQKLSLSENDISDEPPRRALLDLCTLSACLTDLKLSNCNLSDVFVAKLARRLEGKPSLRSLDLSHNLIGVKGGIAIGKVIDSCRLSELNLSWNNLCSDGAVAIARAISKAKYLAILNLDMNGFGQRRTVIYEDGTSTSVAPADEIGCAMASQESMIKKIGLASNDIDPVSAAVIGNGLACSPSIESLNLDSNPFGKRGAMAIMRAVGTLDRRSAVVRMASSLTHTRRREERELAAASAVGKAESVEVYRTPFMKGRTVGKLKGEDGKSLEPELLLLDDDDQKWDGIVRVSMSECAIDVDVVPSDAGRCNPITDEEGQLTNDMRDLTTFRPSACVGTHTFTDLRNCVQFAYASELIRICNRRPGHSVSRVTQRPDGSPVDLDIASWKAMSLSKPRKEGNIEFKGKKFHMPTSGGIRFDYSKVEYSPQAGQALKSTAINSLMHMLENESNPSHGYSMLECLFESHFISGIQARALIDSGFGPTWDMNLRSKAESRMFSRIVGGWQPFVECCSIGKRIALEKFMGKELLYFDLSIPSGHYKLDLSNPQCRLILNKLIEINNDQKNERKALELADTSQKGGFSNFRNEKLDPPQVNEEGGEIPYVVKLFEKGKSTIPESGILEFDYISMTRPDLSNKDDVDLLHGPELTQLLHLLSMKIRGQQNRGLVGHRGHHHPPGAEPLASKKGLGTVAKLKRALVVAKEKKETTHSRLVLVRNALHGKWVRTMECESILKKLREAGEDLVEFTVILFSRVVDIENFRAIFDKFLTREERDDFVDRVGWLNIFDPVFVDREYVLDLSLKDHWTLAFMLCDLANIEPGENWEDETFQKPDAQNPGQYVLQPGWELGVAWVNNGPPHKGILTLTYTSTGKNCKAYYDERMQHRLSCLIGGGPYWSDALEGLRKTTGKKSWLSFGNFMKLLLASGIMRLAEEMNKAEEERTEGSEEGAGTENGGNVEAERGSAESENDDDQEEGEVASPSKANAGAFKLHEKVMELFNGLLELVIKGPGDDAENFTRSLYEAFLARIEGDELHGKDLKELVLEDMEEVLKLKRRGSIIG